MSLPREYISADTLSTPEVCERANVTYRQLDLWSRHGVIKPAKDTTGSGDYRRWNESDVDVIHTMGRISRALRSNHRNGCPTDLLREVAAHPNAGVIHLGEGVEVRWTVAA